MEQFSVEIFGKDETFVEVAPRSFQASLKQASREWKRRFLLENSSSNWTFKLQNSKDCRRIVKIEPKIIFSLQNLNFLTTTLWKKLQK